MLPKRPSSSSQNNPKKSGLHKPGPSGRLRPVSRPEPEPEQDEFEADPDNYEETDVSGPTQEITLPTPRSSGRQSASSRSTVRRGPPGSAGKQVQERGGASERSSGLSNRNARSGAKKDKRGADPMLLYGGIAAGVVVLLIGAYLLVGGSNGEKTAEKANAAEQDFQIDDNATYEELEKAATQCVKNHNMSRARELLVRAAEKAQKLGHNREAMRLNMKAKDVIANSKLSDR